MIHPEGPAKAGPSASLPPRSPSVQGSPSAQGARAPVQRSAHATPRKGLLTDRRLSSLIDTQYKKSPKIPLRGFSQKRDSAGLAVRRRLATTRAELRQFKTIRRIATILLRDVVALLALRAGQSDLGANVLGLACHGCFPRLVSSLARPVGSKNW